MCLGSAIANQLPHVHPARCVRGQLPAPGPSSRKHASARASGSSRSLPETGEFAHTQFITAMPDARSPRSASAGRRNRPGVRFLRAK